ncbi:MAG: acetyl-CoA carboxylase biotin carboxyl carrier protein subunit [Candidatus Zixiibacteriota bacterium]
MSSREFVFNGDIVPSIVEKDGDELKVKVGEKEFVFRSIGDNLYVTTLNGVPTRVAVVKYKGQYHIDVDSVVLNVEEKTDALFARGAIDHGGEKDKVFAPMPGKIVKIMVNIGDTVVEKQPLVIVEAMKMENQVNSRAKGKVKAIHFSAGDQVDTESPIIELELTK